MKTFFIIFSLANLDTDERKQLVDMWRHIVLIVVLVVQVIAEHYIVVISLFKYSSVILTIQLTDENFIYDSYLRCRLPWAISLFSKIFIVCVEKLFKESG